MDFFTLKPTKKTGYFGQKNVRKIVLNAIAYALMQFAPLVFYVTREILANAAQ